MAEETNAGGGQAVVVIKKKKGNEHAGHHGGAWKVAYADFVTAMMAFFLLLWLLSTTTQEQKEGIAHYFNPPNNATEYGGGTGIMGGSAVVAIDGHAPMDVPIVTPPQESGEQDLALQAKEDALFRQVAEELKKAVMNIPELKALLENLHLDVTPEGLRITITDSEGRELFENGSAVMYPYTEKMVGLVASVVALLPNGLSVGGHTDIAPYRGASPSYTNWELSSDRAQAARKILMRESIPETRIKRVAGYASQDAMFPDNPQDIRNRRITIIVLRSKQGTVAKFSEQGLQAPPEKPEIR